MTSAVNEAKDTGKPRVWRSPGAVVIWWLWVAFAVANLIDLAVQGRDHLSLVAAFILVFVTGIVYASALRPRVITGDDGLTIVNPFRDHRIGWTAVAGADSTDLLRVRCEWPDREGTERRVVYAWAVHSSRRRKVAAEMRQQRQARRGSRGIGVAGGFGASGASGAFGTPAAPEPASLGVDADQVIATLTERAEQARLDTPGAQGEAPASTWCWPAVAAVVIPALALLVVALL